jgi:fructan beta-fructosidase
MSNWDYAQEVPTSPWRSAMSIPREVGLRKTAHGLRLVQKPVHEQAQLRDRHFQFTGGELAAANAWLKKNEIAGNQLELVVEFETTRTGVQGIRVLTGSNEATVIGLDFARARMFLDRTQSGNIGFHPEFSGVHEAPLPLRDGGVRLHIFLDACSVEVFANEGETVITDLVFPSETSRGVEFFGSMQSAKVRSLDVWTLKSAWR